MDWAKTQQLEDLYRSERLRLERIAMRRVGTGGAGDVVQDVCATLWARALDQMRLTTAYLAQVTKCTAISPFRATSRHARFLGGNTAEQYAAPVAGPDQIVADRQSLRDLERVILALPRRGRSSCRTACMVASIRKSPSGWRFRPASSNAKWRGRSWPVKVGRATGARAPMTDSGTDTSRDPALIQREAVAWFTRIGGSPTASRGPRFRRLAGPRTRTPTGL